MSKKLKSTTSSAQGKWEYEDPLIKETVTTWTFHRSNFENKKFNVVWSGNELAWNGSSSTNPWTTSNGWHAIELLSCVTQLASRSWKQNVSGSTSYIPGKDDIEPVNPNDWYQEQEPILNSYDELYRKDYVLRKIQGFINFYLPVDYNITFMLLLWADPNRGQDNNNYPQDGYDISGEPITSRWSPSDSSVDDRSSLFNQHPIAHRLTLMCRQLVVPANPKPFNFMATNPRTALLPDNYHLLWHYTRPSSSTNGGTADKQLIIDIDVPNLRLPAHYDRGYPSGGANDFGFNQYKIFLAVLVDGYYNQNQQGMINGSFSFYGKHI